MTEAGDHQATEAQASAQPNRRWLLLLALVLILMYAAGVNGHWRFQRDSARYMGLARSLAEDGTYSLNGERHVFALPGFPAMLSLIYMAWGENFLAMNVLVSAFGLGCILLAYLLYGRLSLTRFQVVACALLFAFSRTLYHYSTHILTDVPFTFFVLVTLYCGTRMLEPTGRRKALWALGAAVAAWVACAVRPLGPALLIALTAAPWTERGARRRARQNLGWTALFLLPAAALGALWACRGAELGAPLGSTYYYRFVGRRGAMGVLRHIAGSVPSLVKSLSDTICGSHLGVFVSVLMALLMLVGLWVALRRGERLLCIFGIVYIVGICVGSPGRRYLLPVLPVLLYWLVLGLAAAGSWLTARWPKAIGPWVKPAAQVMLALALLVNITHLSKSIYEARMPNFYSRVEDGRLPDYWRLIDWLRQNATPDDCVLAYESEMIHYFSRLRTLRTRMPAGDHGRRCIALIKREGVTYMVIDPEKRYPARGLKQVMAEHPQAFEWVAAFGKLQLFRVHSDRM